MDKELSESFTQLELLCAQIALNRQSKNFEELLLKFTCVFLTHTDMLKQFSYEEIVKKAYNFTKTYLNYVPDN